jgi:ribulose-phosphate 3-epimerase
LKKPGPRKSSRKRSWRECARPACRLFRVRNWKTRSSFIASGAAAHVETVLDDLDQILVMTVNPGFGGQSFIHSMLPKIQQLRSWIDARGLAVTLEVDGGVKPGIIGLAAGAGATAFVAGTAVYGAKDYRAAIEGLRREAEAALPEGRG